MPCAQCLMKETEIKNMDVFQFQPITLEAKELIESYTKPWALDCSVYAGSRFCFEIEMSARSESDYQYFDVILDSINNKSFRLGGNTRNGLGMVKTVSCKTARFNLSDSNDLQEYLSKSSSLSKPLSSVFIERNNNQSKNIDDKWLDYELKIKPDDFFFFGSGFGDALNVADMVGRKPEGGR